MATVLNEIAAHSNVGISLRETAIPVRDTVRGACEILGLDPLYVANEGKLVAIVPAAVCGCGGGRMRQNPLGREARIIGEVVSRILRHGIDENRNRRNASIGYTIWRTTAANLLRTTRGEFARNPVNHPRQALSIRDRSKRTPVRRSDGVTSQGGDDARLNLFHSPGATAAAPSPVKDVHIIWLTAGLSCDGDSVSVTAAEQPSIEDVLLGAIPGLPKVHLHNPVLAYEVGDDFMKYFYQAETGETRSVRAGGGRLDSQRKN